MQFHFMGRDLILQCVIGWSGGGSQEKKEGVRKEKKNSDVGVDWEEGYCNISIDRSTRRG